MNKTTLNSQKEKHSMLSLRRATFVGLAAHRLRNISIHALLAESDADNGDAGNGCDAISIHALLAESDSLYMDSVPPASRFLSTLSLRRATRLFLEIYTLFKNFYPRSPCGERRVVHVAQDPSPGRISIHALLAESDPAGNGGSGSITAISIHALLAESDFVQIIMSGYARISIHALLAESDGVDGSGSVATSKISIHALLAESDKYSTS